MVKESIVLTMYGKNKIVETISVGLINENQNYVKENAK